MKKCASGPQQKHVHSATDNGWLENMHIEKLINPYPTAFPYGNGMVLHFYQQQESSTYGVPVRERYGSTLLPATREQHDQNCTQSH